jgi:hypothetical protein
MSVRRKILLGISAMICLAFVLLIGRLLLVSAFDPIRTDHGYSLEAYSLENFPIISHQFAGRRNTPNLSILRNYRHLTNPGSEDISGERFSFYVYHDAMGARVNVPDSIPPKTIDFVACGESSSWGFGLPNEKTYVSLIEKELGLKGANVSSIGATPLQCYFLLRDSLEYGVKMLIFYFWEEYYSSSIARCVNAHSPVCVPHPYLVPDENAGFRVVLPDNPERDLNLWRLYDIETQGGPETTFLTDLFWRYYQSKTDLLERFETRSRFASPHNRPYSSEKISAMNHILGMLRQLTEENEVNLIVAYIPFWSNDPSYLSKLSPETEAYMRENGIVFTNLSDDFNALKQQEKQFHFADGHLNATGHSLVASKIIDTGLLQRMESSEKNQFAPPIAAPVEKIIRENLP